MVEAPRKAATTKGNNKKKPTKAPAEEKEDEPEVEARDRASTGTWTVPEYLADEPVDVPKYFRVEEKPDGTKETFVPCFLPIHKASDANWQRDILYPYILANYSINSPEEFDNAAEGIKAVLTHLRDEVRPVMEAELQRLITNNAILLGIYTYVTKRKVTSFDQVADIWEEDERDESMRVFFDIMEGILLRQVGGLIYTPGAVQ